MFLISKIITKEWTKSLVGSLIVLYLLVSVGDILNGFLQNYEVKRIFLEYFLKVPEFTSKMLPICALLATLFSINKLKNHSELMAILAAGFSAKKIYSLVLGCSLLVGLAQFLNVGYIIPAANKVKRQQFEKSEKNESKYLARSRVGNTGLVWYKSNNYFTSFEIYDTQRALLRGVTVHFINDQNKLDSIYKAERAYYESDKKWRLQNVEIIQFLNTDTFPSTIKTEELFLELDESPEDFKQFEADITTLNIFELKSFISKLEETEINSTEYETMFFEKISLTLICIVFSIFPLASIFNPNRRATSFGKSIVFTLLICVVFWLLHSGSISLGNTGKIPVSLAALGIPTAFSLYIFVVFLKNRKL